MEIAYPARLSMARLPTPMEFASSITKQTGDKNPIYFKRDDLSGMGMSGNKIRKLEFLLAEAKEKGADVVITAGGIQSNHCRATAAACAKLGLRCHLILRGEASFPYDGNLLLDRLFGAELRFYPTEEFRNNFKEILEETRTFYKKRDLNTYYFPVGGSVATGAWGYIKAFEELCQQIDSLKEKEQSLREKRWYIVVAVGSGGTMAGLLLGKMLFKRDDVEIIGFNVCNDAEYFIGEISKIATEFKDKYNTDISPEDISPRIIEGYVGEGYAIPYPEVLETIRVVARSEGVILDPVYTGKAFYGLMEQIKKGIFEQGCPIVFIHTGGTFSIFAYRERFV